MAQPDDTSARRELEIIKRGLSEQVAYIKKLEATNRQYLRELEQYRESQKSIQVVEEEKRAMAAKLSMMDDLRNRLAEVQLQNRILRDEKKNGSTSRKRPREDDNHAEGDVLDDRLNSYSDSSGMRILSLRGNPTAQVEAIKMATLNTLRQENAALLAQLEGKPHSTKVVPISTLEHHRLQLEDLRATLAQSDKKALRLKQIYSAKSLEFREAVASILGWKLDFLPNGRVKATSILYPSHVEEGEGEVENSIIFDGENGTMKVSGGPESVFASEIKGMIEYWVEGRKEIPCFLAALTLEFYERANTTGT